MVDSYTESARGWKAVERDLVANVVIPTANNIADNQRAGYNAVSPQMGRYLGSKVGVRNVSAAGAKIGVKGDRRGIVLIVEYGSVEHDIPNSFGQGRSFGIGENLDPPRPAFHPGTEAHHVLDSSVYGAV